MLPVALPRPGVDRRLHGDQATGERHEDDGEASVHRADFIRDGRGAGVFQPRNHATEPGGPRDDKHTEHTQAGLIVGAAGALAAIAVAMPGRSRPPTAATAAPR